MRIVRTIEGICGVLSGALGLAALGVAFWAPGGTTCSTTITAGGSATQTCAAVSYIAENGLSGILPIIIGFSIVFVVIALGAALHGWWGVREGRGMLWVATAVLAFGNFLTILDIGVFLLPSTLLALVASLLAIVGRRRAAGLAAG